MPQKTMVEAAEPCTDEAMSADESVLISGQDVE